MNLPNFFLADLPPEAVVAPTMLQEACRTLKHNRERYLAGRTTSGMIGLLCEAGANWLRADYPIRQMALGAGPQATGFSEPVLRQGIERFFRRFTPGEFERLLVQDLGSVARLDQFAASEPEEKGGRWSMARGPEFLVHIGAGNLPDPTWMSMTLGLLLRSAQFVKCASGGSFLPRLFAHSLYELDPKVGACLELAEWPGESGHLNKVLYEEADCLTVTGSDGTLAAVRGEAPPGLQVVGYGRKLSFGYVSAEALSGTRVLGVVGRAAEDVVAWNQLGCLSPHVIYVEQGGGTSPEQFAELLAKELEERERLAPRGEVGVREAAAIAGRRSIYELRAANAPGTRCWSSRGSTAWTVVYEEDGRFQASCLNRFIYVKAVPGLAAALEGADAVRRSVSTVGLAVAEHQAKELAGQLARWGATRVCGLGQMQNPPLSWRHDGRPSLGELVAWTDWEGGL